MSDKEENAISTVFSIFGDENVKFKKYESLSPRNEYDKKKATELAEAMTELIVVEKRIAYLKSLFEENEELQPFLWRGEDGRVQAFHDIDEGHFKNIIKYVAQRGRVFSKEMKAEAAERGIEIPSQSVSRQAYVLDEDDEEELLPLSF